MKKKTKTAVCLLIFALLSGSLLPPVCTSAASRKEEVREFANLVVFVQFEPLTAKNFVKDKGEEIFKLWEDPGYGTSLSSYLTEISYGQFQVHNIFPQYDGVSFTPYVVPPESASDEYSLVDYVIDQIQTSETLDYDGDGTVDNLVIVADKPFSDDRGSPFYSHKANYDGSGTIGGKEVFSYNMLNGYSVFEDSISREGVICHEFLHSIGFPDLYRDSRDLGSYGKLFHISSVPTCLPAPVCCRMDANRYHYRICKGIDFGYPDECRRNSCIYSEIPSFLQRIFCSGIQEKAGL